MFEGSPFPAIVLIDSKYIYARMKPLREIVPNVKAVNASRNLP